MIMKKNGFVTTGIVSFLVYIGVVLVIILFYLIFKLGIGDTTVKISGYSTNTNIEFSLLNFLRTPVDINVGSVKKSVPIGDLVGMMGIAEGSQERAKIFQNAANIFFEEQYPYTNLPDWKGVNPWWLRIYAEDETPKEISNGRYFDVFPIPGKGYTYGPGSNCNPDKDSVTQVIIPEINGEKVKLVFCVLKSFNQNMK